MYYAVRKGHKTGIFDNWTDAQVATSGFASPEYKKFQTKEEAEAYLDNRDIWEEQVALDNKQGYLVAFTDGSYDKDLNRYSYGVILILPDGKEQGLCSYGNNEKYIDSNNIIGEIFGVINAFDWALSNGYEKIKIYHDYEGLSKWLNGEWNAKAKASKMFVELYKTKFKDFLKAEFVKIPAHSNIIYNEKADQLAKSALINRQKCAISGEHWFSIPYFNEDDFNAFSEIIRENDDNISYTTDHKNNKTIYRFQWNVDVVTITLFKTGQHKLLVQGKNSYLFQVITTILVELCENANIEEILGNAYRVNIRKADINDVFIPIKNGLPNQYPPGIERLIKQAVINLTYYIDSEDYSQYVFPALRALEGHIKYLITLAGGSVGRRFTCFKCDRTVVPNKYIVQEVFPDTSRNQYIENCYNYYVSQRHTSVHFGDVLNETYDNTRFIETKEEADEIINKCINLIITQQ